MPKGGARRRKRRPESDNATKVSKDTVGCSSNGSERGMSSTTGWLKRNTRTLVLTFGAVVVVLFFSLSGQSSSESTLPTAESDDKDASHRSRQQQESQATATSTTRDSSMDGPGYKVLQVLSHDSGAFTQGLTYLNGYLYESTGYHGQSQVRRVDPSTGKVLDFIDVNPKYFGEGLAHFVDKDGIDCLIHLTWQEETGFIYRASDLEIFKIFTFNTSKREGWGITYDPLEKEFIVSDGSHYLHFWDYETLEETRRVEVQLPKPSRDGTSTEMQSISYLNELEWYRPGIVLANVWYNDVILLISTITGHVEKVYRFDNLYKDRTAKADCFNGIALSERQDELYVTGKWWPHLYKIQLLE